MPNKHDFSAAERRRLTEKGEAMPDGAFPIRNRQDLQDAVHAIGRAKNRAAAKRWISKRAGELDATDALPEDW